MDLATLFEGRQPRLMYHGTSSMFLRSILKQGIVPDPKARRWDTDDQQSPYSFNRASLPGSYWASNMMTASSSAHNTMRKFGGEEIIVIAQIVEQSAYADEDSINGQLTWAMNDTAAAKYPQVRHDLWLVLGDDLFGKDASKRDAMQQVFTANLHRHLKGGAKHVPDRALTDALLDTLVMRNMAFEKKNGLRLEMWMEQVPELPSIAEIDQRLQPLRDRLTRAYRATTHYTDEDSFIHTLRIPTRVGFRGSNRIRWIIQQRKWEWEDKILIVHPIMLIYGSPDLPKDFLDQYRARIGEFPGLVDREGRWLHPSERVSVVRS